MTFTRFLIILREHVTTLNLVVPPHSLGLGWAGLVQSMQKAVQKGQNNINVCKSREFDPLSPAVMMEH